MQAAGSLDGVLQANAQTGWSAMLSGLNAEERASSRYADQKSVPHLLVDSAGGGMYDASTNDRQSLTLLSVVVAVLLLIVCASRFVATLLFGLAPTDPATIVLAVATMIVVSMLAGYLPARRAARVDPMVALRYE